MPDSTIIIIDTSDYMQNGDYSPSRNESQLECLHAVINGRLARSPENVVGVLASGSKSQRVLSALTNSQALILKGIHQAEIGGLAEIKKTLHVAKLALDYSPEPYFGKRIVLFVGSPITDLTQEDVKELVTFFRKNEIMLDIVSFGEVVENAPLLELFQNEMGNNCVYVPIPTGPHIMRDILATTEIIKRDGGLHMYGGNDDPEYQRALEESMRDFMGVDGQYDEEAAIMAAINNSLAEMNAPQTNRNYANTSTQVMEEEDDDMDEEMRLAIALSMQGMEQEEEKDDKEENKKDN